MERAYQNANPDALEARVRFEKVLQTTAICNTRYVTYNIFTKDNDLHTQVGASVEQMAKWVYWHFIDVRQLFGRQAEFTGVLRGALKDPDRLSFQTLPTSDRPGAIALMHNGRSASVMALGAFAGLPGIIPYLYQQGFTVRKLPDNL